MKKEDSNANKDIISLAHQNFSKSLNLHAQYKINSKETCNDLVQETFLKTFRYLEKGEEIILMRAFLYHVLNKLIIDEYRKKKTVSLDELFEKGYDPAVDTQDSLMNSLDGKRAMLLINSLPEIYKSCISMKYIENLDMNEMASLTGKSKNALTVQLHRGLKKLKILYLTKT